jgi:multiple sugar transport system ATP-binding protein
MNFLPAAIHADHLETPFGDVPFAADQLPARSDGDDHLIAGIRPEDVHEQATLSEEQLRASVTFEAHVDVVEWLGDEQLLYVPFEAPESIARLLAELGRELDEETPRTQMIVKLGAETEVREGAQIALAFDPRDVHVFEPHGERVTTQPRPAAA